MISPEYIQHTPEALLSLAPFLLAFSLNIRKLIGKRDKWKCQDEGCNESFQTGSMVHASHYTHDKSDPNYDTVDAGRIQCVKHHLIYHQQHVGKAQEIGLCEEANNRAIDLLKKTNPKKTKPLQR